MNDGEFKIIRQLRLKLKNRRILAVELDDGTCAFYFKRLRDDGSINKESIRLTKEALYHMSMFAFDYNRQLEGESE